jgi:hypothetical protein
MPILPTWAKYSAPLNLDAKEPLETFGWMKNPTDFEDMRQALKAADATEWLKNYPPPRQGFFPFNEPIAHKVAAGLKGIANHSGSSVMCLFRSYQGVLNNWDEWVLNTKTHQARAAYDAEQISFKELESLYFMGERASLYDTEEAWQTFKDAAQSECNLRKTLALVHELYIEALKYKKGKETEEMDKRFNEQLDALEFQYEHPQRWFNNSLFGPPQNILQRHMDVMEGRHPGYTQHIADIIARQKIEAAGGY